MRTRIIFVAVMTILLVAGTCSSTACEMMCAPSSHTGACCPQQMQHAMSSCSGAVATIKSAIQCVHPQDDGVAALNSVGQAFQAGLTNSVIASAVQSHIPATITNTLPAVALLQRSSITPLRI